MQKLIFLLLLCSFQTAAAQDSTIRRLKQELRMTDDDSTRISLLVNLGNHTGVADTAATHRYFQQAIRLSRNRYPLLRTVAYANYGRFYFYLYDLERAGNYLDTAINALQQAPSGSEVANVALALRKFKAIIYGEKGAIEKQQQTYIDLLPLVEKAGNYKELAEIYQNLGVIFMNKKQYPQSLVYYRKSYETVQQHLPENTEMLIKKQLDMALVFNDMNVHDSTLFYLDLAKGELDKKQAFIHEISENFYYLSGEYYRKKKEYRKAENQYQQGLKASRKFNNIHYICNNLYGLAEIYKARGRYAAAQDLMKEYYKISRELKDFNFQGLALKSLAGIAESAGNIKDALYYQKAYNQVTDSLKEHEIVQRMQQLETQYQTLQKEKEISELKNQEYRAQSSLKFSRLVNIALGGVLLAIVVFLAIIYSSYRRRKTIMHQQHEINLLSAMVKGEEKERGRLAKDLHDGLGGLLSGIRLSVASIERKVAEPEQKAILAGLKTRTDGAIQEMRRVSHGLSVSIMAQNSLPEALSNYCKYLQHEQTRIIFQAVNIDTDIPRHKSYEFYRIAQELINNALKHARARQILVELQQRAGKLYLTVEDDGKGFDPAVAENGDTIGLKNIRYRITAIGGAFEIASSPAGTGITVWA